MKHVAIIMDGNGRWATAQGRPRTDGHIKGASVAADIVKAASLASVQHLTLYAFSTENWKRPAQEISTIFATIEQFLKANFNRGETCEVGFDLQSLRSQVRLSVIGDLEPLPAGLKLAIRTAKVATSHNNGMELVLALNYGAQSEITNYFREVAEESLAEFGDLSLVQESVVVQRFAAHRPPPDLIIRTGGEKRLSNFLLWEAAYSELIFMDKSWPEFTAADFTNALQVFEKRQRRYGAL